jgi:hypothetical protein
VVVQEKNILDNFADFDFNFNLSCKQVFFNTFWQGGQKQLQERDKVAILQHLYAWTDRK